MLGTQGRKTVVMTKAEFLAHPDRAVVQGKPILYAEQSWNAKDVIIKGDN